MLAVPFNVEFMTNYSFKLLIIPSQSLLFHGKGQVKKKCSFFCLESFRHRPDLIYCTLLACHFHPEHIRQLHTHKNAIYVGFFFFAFLVSLEEYEYLCFSPEALCVI